MVCLHQKIKNKKGIAAKQNGLQTRVKNKQKIIFGQVKKQTKYASRASTLITLLLFNDLFAQILPTLIKCYLKLSTYLDLIKANGQNRQTLKIY